MDKDKPAQGEFSRENDIGHQHYQHISMLKCLTCSNFVSVKKRVCHVLRGFHRSFPCIVMKAGVPYSLFMLYVFSHH